MLKNAHLRRSPHPSSLRRTVKYVLRPAHPLAGGAKGRSLFVATPLSGFQTPRICLPAEASAQAGAFLSILKKLTFQSPLLSSILDLLSSIFYLRSSVFSFSLQCCEHLLRGDGKIFDPNPNGIEDGTGNRRGGGCRRGFADAFGAKGS